MTLRRRASSPGGRCLAIRESGWFPIGPSEAGVSSARFESLSLLRTEPVCRELLILGKSVIRHTQVVLDMDSTEIPVYGEQEQSAYNGHFESTCYHPLLLF